MSLGEVEEEVGMKLLVVEVEMMVEVEVVVEVEMMMVVHNWWSWSWRWVEEADLLRLASSMSVVFAM